jgi:urease accessory protein UreH
MDKHSSAFAMHGSLDFAICGQRWSLKQRAPLYLNVLPHAAEHGILAIVNDQSGGLRNGDSHEVRIDLCDQAHVLWSPAASTIFYPGIAASRVAVTTTAMVVGEGCSLRFFAHPSIPCAGAQVQQNVQLAVSENSECIYWDLWSSGRSSRGEGWDTAHLEGSLQVKVGTNIVYRENWQLNAEKNLLGRGGFQGARIWISGLAYGPQSIAEIKQRVANLKSYEPAVAVELGMLTNDLLVVKGLDFNGIATHAELVSSRHS